MKPMPWKGRPGPLLSDPKVHVEQLVRNNQPSTVRSALASSRASARFLIRGFRMVNSQDGKFRREVFDTLKGHRHSVQVYVQALNRMGEPTYAQTMAMP